jgi:UDP-galactopyranose mutase
LKKILVIGGGFAGCLAAHMLALKGETNITMLERSPYLGGTCRTFWYGGHPYTLGPRHFLNKREDVYNFMDKYCPMRRYDGHEFLTYVERDQKFYHFPIHEDEVKEMPDADKIIKELAQCDGVDQARNLEEFWLRSVGPTLYDKFVDGYSKKMWQIESNTDIIDFGFTAKGVALKTGPKKAAWTEVFAGFPRAPNGYDDYFPIATENVDVHLETVAEEYDIENKRIKVEGEWHTYDVIISTISPEVLLDNAFGELRWMGRDFFKIVLPVEEVFPKDIFFLYYANEEPFTRIVEYKKFYENKSPSTLIGIEIPSFKNKLYPYPMQKDQDLAKKYIDALPEDVHSIGRMGTYRYLDIGNNIEMCMDLVKDI